MKPDGTITDFRMDGGLHVGRCTPSSDVTFSGTVTASSIRVTLTDRATCLDFSANPRDGIPRDADRTLTISVGRRAP
jgi:hypothetical protein